MEVVTALLISAFLAFVVGGVRRRSLKELIAGLKTYAQGMGRVFTPTVFLVVSADAFAARFL